MDGLLLSGQYWPDKTGGLFCDTEVDMCGHHRRRVCVRVYYVQNSFPVTFAGRPHTHNSRSVSHTSERRRTCVTFPSAALK